MDAAEQLYVALQHAAARLREIDAEMGLSPARFSVLATLRYEGPQRVGELARREGVAQPTMTETVRRLELHGLVVRRVVPGDGRGSLVELTAVGRALVRRARARKIRWVGDALAGLPEPDHQALRRAASVVDEHARRSG